MLSREENLGHRLCRHIHSTKIAVIIIIGQGPFSSTWSLTLKWSCLALPSNVSYLQVNSEVLVLNNFSHPVVSFISSFFGGRGCFGWSGIFFFCFSWRFVNIFTTFGVLQALVVLVGGGDGWWIALVFSHTLFTVMNVTWVCWVVWWQVFLTCFFLFNFSF